MRPDNYLDSTTRWRGGEKEPHTAVQSFFTPSPVNAPAGVKRSTVHRTPAGMNFRKENNYASYIETNTGDDRCRRGAPGRLCEGLPGRSLHFSLSPGRDHERRLAAL